MPVTEPIYYTTSKPLTGGNLDDRIQGLHRQWCRPTFIMSTRDLRPDGLNALAHLIHRENLHRRSRQLQKHSFLQASFTASGNEPVEPPMRQGG